MVKEERRRFTRVQIYDPISYLSVDVDGEVLEQNVAVVRNVSQTGVQIESFLPIRSEYISLMFFDMDQKPIEVKGEVIYSERNDSDQYNIGISFIGKNKETLQFVKALVKSYHYQKEKSSMVISPGIQN